VASLSTRELEKKYHLDAAQKARIREAREKNEIPFTIVEEPISRLTGVNDPIIDSKIAVLKYDEGDIKKLLNL